MPDTCNVTIWITATPKWWARPLGVALRVAARLGLPRRLFEPAAYWYAVHGWVLHFGKPGAAKEALDA